MTRADAASSSARPSASAGPSGAVPAGAAATEDAASGMDGGADDASHAVTGRQTVARITAAFRRLDTAIVAGGGAIPVDGFTDACTSTIRLYGEPPPPGLSRDVGAPALTPRAPR
jgi:hypothetical protein